MTNRMVVVLLAIFAVGASLGIVGAIALSEDDPASSSTPAAVPTTIEEIECPEARTVIDGAVDRMAEIEESETREAPFFAALLVEQRTITYVMDVAPDCFSLQERAAGEGLLEGIRGLLSASAAAAAQPAAFPDIEIPIDAPLEPTDDSATTPSTSEAPSDSGE